MPQSSIVKQSEERKRKKCKGCFVKWVETKNLRFVAGVGRTVHTCGMFTNVPHGYDGPIEYPWA
jgi:hypothetical protein